MIFKIIFLLYLTTKIQLNFAYQHFLRDIPDFVNSEIADFYFYDELYSDMPVKELRKRDKPPNLALILVETSLSRLRKNLKEVVSIIPKIQTSINYPPFKIDFQLEKCKIRGLRDIQITDVQIESELAVEVKWPKPLILNGVYNMNGTVGGSKTGTYTGPILITINNVSLKITSGYKFVKNKFSLDDLRYEVTSYGHTQSSMKGLPDIVGLWVGKIGQLLMIELEKSYHKDISLELMKEANKHLKVAT